MPRRENLVQMSQASGDVASYIENENAVLRGHRFVKMIKRERGDAVERRIGYGLDRRRAWKRFQDAHFPKKIPRSQLRQFDFVRAAEMLADSHQTFPDHEEPIARLSLAHRYGA